MLAPGQVAPEATPQPHAHVRVSPVSFFATWDGTQPLGHETCPGRTTHVLPNAPPLLGTHVPAWFLQAPAPAMGTVHTVLSCGGFGGIVADAGAHVPCVMFCG